MLTLSTATPIAKCQATISALLATELGASVEVTVGGSIARGPFLALAGTREACDAARGLVEAAGATFTDRDEDESPVVDFYSLGAR